MTYGDYKQSYLNYLVKVLAYHGALRMDREDKNWFKETDTRLLDLADGSACILGQSFGLYSTGRGELGFTSDQDAALYGFVIPDEILDSSEFYSALTEAWLEEIRKRQPRCVCCNQLLSDL